MATINKKFLAGNVNIATIFVGWMNKWINTEDLKELFCANSFFVKHEDFLIELYVNDFSEDFIGKNFRTYLSVYALESNETIEEMLAKEHRRWEYLSLGYVNKSDELDTEQKMHLLSNIWEDLNYPEVWRNFIYYLPSSGGGILVNFRTRLAELSIEFNKA